MKKFIVFLYVVCLTVLMSFPASALTVSDTYSDVASTSSQAVNLVNYAANFESFIDSEFVIFCDSQNSYYIVWGDLENNNGIISGSDVEYIHYYRTDNYNSYTYQYGTEVSFGLNPDNLCTSNIENFGFRSSAYETFRLNDNVNKSLMFILAFLFVIMILRLRRDK